MKLAMVILFACVLGCEPISQKVIIKRQQLVGSFLESHNLPVDKIHCAHKTRMTSCEFSEVQIRNIRVTYNIECYGDGNCRLFTRITNE